MVKSSNPIIKIKRIFKQAVIKLLIFYHHHISSILPPACRFQPTCSEYMAIAIEKYGIVKGFWLGFKRVLRCNPFFPGGFDPIP